MKQYFGWAGQILRVNLSTSTVTTEPTSRYAAEALGGRGIGQTILFHELDPSTDPLGEGNKLILSAGPLVGTLAPGSGRLSVDWKNPQTGGVGSANVGGHFAAELKYAGFDSVVIEGQAKEPVFLLIRDGEAKILSASSIWGKTTWETEDILRQHMNDSRLRVASIGPAGENVVRGACLIVDRSRAAGRGGSGTVLGSKKLKAIAVRGTRPIRVYDSESFLKHAVRCWHKLESSSTMASFHAAGTQIASNPGGGWHHQKEIWDLEKFDKIKWQVFVDTLEVRKLGCFNCPVSCSHLYRVTEGPYAGTIGEGVEAITVRTFGCNLDIDDPAVIVKGHILCSQLGIDLDFAASTLGWAFESYQRHLISAGDTGGLELVWGNHDAALSLLEDIVYRRGFGDVLAEGVKRASDALGRGSDKWALHIKGADLNEAMMRHDKAWALGIAVANRGGGHLEGAALGAMLSPTLDALTPAKARDLFGRADLGSLNSYEDKAKVVFWMQRLKAAIDCLGLCYNLSQWSGLDLIGAEDGADLFTSATGVEISSDELMRKGQRLHNIEKAFNTLHAGFRREDDFPPPRFMTEPVNSGPYAGELLHEDQWNRMLDEYYSLQGWDMTTGQQKEKSLLDLGLADVASKLGAYGKLQG